MPPLHHPYQDTAYLQSQSDQGRKSLHHQDMMLHQLGTIYESTRKIEGIFSQVENNAEGIGPALLDFLTSKMDPPDRAQEKKKWQKDLVAAIYQIDDAGSESNVSALSVPLGRRKTLESVFLERLRYPGMQDREQRIAKAHEKTFQWIWEGCIPSEQRWSSFTDWLESDSRLYWITGKAGAGKSTLMKFICQDYDVGAPQQTSDITTSPRRYSMSRSQESRCRKHLKNWAGDAELITATFFFWNSGVNLQMTQKGLVLSLLSQILRQAPDLIPLVSPTRWEALCLFNDDPRELTEPELQEMLRFAVGKLGEHSKVCLFVDGLDEFDGHHDDLIHLMKDLISNRNVKACISSRPWLVFEDAFEHNPSLKLEDLTYADIKTYVTAHLNGSSGFVQLCRREPEYADQLVNNIVSKASGVFLWIHLVVASLLSGMGYGDRVSDLQRRLESLPPDLELLYEKILLSLDPFYLEHAAQLFKLVQESVDPPSILLLSFADEEDSQFALNHRIQSISQDEISLRAETMRRRLNSRCKGFLEVGSTEINLENSDAQTVQYLHRTVKDYIESVDVQRKLQCALKAPFDPHLRLCAGNLVHLKVLEATVNCLTDGRFWNRVQRCLYSASRIQTTYRSRIVPLLDELDRTGSWLAKQIAKHNEALPILKNDLGGLLSSFEAGEWVSSLPSVVPPLEDGGWFILNQTARLQEHSYAPNFVANFLSLAVRYGIVEYVQAKAEPGCLVRNLYHELWPLLFDAIDVNSSWRNKYRENVPHLEMITCLLRKGADPNFLISRVKFSGGLKNPRWTLDAPKTLSLWTLTLAHILNDFDGNLRPPWQAIARVMIEHKAEVKKNLIPVSKYIEWSWRLSSVPLYERPVLGEREAKLYEELLAIKRATSKSRLPWRSSAKK